MNLRTVKLRTACFILIILICSSVFANGHRRIGSDFTLEVNNNGIGQESIVTIFTDVEKTQGKDLTISIRSAVGETALRTVVAASKNGSYSFPIVFDSTGEWGVWSRYGFGLDSYERVRRFQINDAVEVVEVGSSSYRGYLRPDVPNYVQPMGYAIFGTLLLCTLLMLARLFYWLNNKHRKQTI